MMSGYERYYQIARCFRDEDLRADRQPEFTQLDVEMAFVDEDDVIETIEAVMGAVFAGGRLRRAGRRRGRAWPTTRRCCASAPTAPTAASASRSSTSPQALRGSEFKVFESVLGGGGAVRALNAGAREMSRSELEGLNEVVQRHGGKAVAWGFVEDGALALADRQVPRARTAWRRPSGSCAASEGDLLLFVADQPRVAAEALGALRLELGRRFGLIPEGGHDVLWVVDFPMFEPSRRRLGRRAPPVHRARRATSPIRARCSRAATTSSSTAGSSAAGRSASTRPRSRSRSSRSSA